MIIYICKDLRKLCVLDQLFAVFFNRAFAQELADVADEGRRHKSRQGPGDVGEMLMLHAAVSLSQADRAASFRRDRSDSMEGTTMSSTRRAPQTLLVSLCLPVLTLRTVWQNIVQLWRETEQQSDRCLGSLIDGSCKNELESIWNGENQGDRTETQSSKITSSPGDSDSLSGQF